jgi:MOSC domain-containing protein YiiM
MRRNNRSTNQTKSGELSIASVSLNPAHGFSKQPQPCITLIAGEGVEGDAHRGTTTQHLYLKRKNPTLPNLAQVHLLSTEILAGLLARGFTVQPGELGENILTTGLDLHALPTNTRLHIGQEVMLKVTGLRTPCSQIDRYQPGLQAELWGPRDADNKKTRHAGIMATVETGGTLEPGDTLRIEFPQPPHMPLGPV